VLFINVVKNVTCFIVAVYRPIIFIYIVIDLYIRLVLYILAKYICFIYLFNLFNL